MLKSNFFRKSHSERYTLNFFKNKRIQNEIKENGFAVVDLINQKEIDDLKNGFLEIKNMMNNDFGANFWPSGRSNNIKIREFAKDQINKVLPNNLSSIFIQNSYRLIGGTYLIKPSSTTSDLSPHQDSSHILEAKQFSVYCWVPLQDVSAENGCLYVLPKSHKINISQRSLNVPWVLKDHTDYLKKLMIPVPMKAGQALFFDAALIHSSPTNESNKTRVAVNYYIHPKNEPFCHYFYNSKIDKVEVFSVSPDFYYSEDFEKRPSAKYPLIDTQDLSISNITLKELKHISKNLMQENKIVAFFNKLSLWK
jgi:hypothetical protein